MCAMHVHPRNQAEEGKTREVADTSCVFQLTVLEKCCNITKVVVGKVKYILRTCILAYKCEKCILLMSVGKRKARS
mgnify:CR=1 FL=1